MALAQATNYKFKYLAEVTPGVTPSAAMTLANLMNTGINLTINTTESATINTTGDTADIPRTSASSGGDFGFEYNFGEFRPFIESALRGTFSTAVAISATTISASSVDNSYNDSASGFSIANILPGHWIKVAGFTTAANNALAKVVSVTTAKIVVSHVILVDEVAGDTITISGRSCRNGIIKKTFTLEEEFGDLTTTFTHFRGQHVNTMNINANSEAIITGSFGFMGMDGEYATATAGTGAEVAAPSVENMTSTANVGTIFIDGVAQSSVYFKNINLTTNGNDRSLTAINNLYPVAINMGTISIQFAVTAFFSDTTLLTKFVDGTAFSLAYSFYDANGKVVVIDAPRCKFNSGTLDGKTKNSDIMQNLSITALRDTTLPYAIQISELG